MELQGEIKKIGIEQTFSSGFVKREMVLLTEEQYPQPINIEFVQDKADLLDPYKEGDKVKISINIRGREWTSPTGDVKYFNSIVGWRIEKLDDGKVEPYNAAVTTANVVDAFAEDEDDLPF